MEFAVSIVQDKGTSITVGKRHTVGLWTERSKSNFIGLTLACEGHSHIGSAMEGIRKCDDDLSFSRISGNLYGIFNRLCVAVYKHCLFLKISRDNLIYPSCKLNIRIIHCHVKTCVEKMIYLIFNSGHHLLCTMLYIFSANYACKINIFPAFNSIT